VHPEQANVCAAKNRLIREVYFSANKRTGTSRILCFSNREAQDTCAAHKSVACSAWPKKERKKEGF